MQIPKRPPTGRPFAFSSPFKGAAYRNDMVPKPDHGIRCPVLCTLEIPQALPDFIQVACFFRNLFRRGRGRKQLRDIPSHGHEKHGDHDDHRRDRLTDRIYPFLHPGLLLCRYCPDPAGAIVCGTGFRGGAIDDLQLGKEEQGIDCGDRDWSSVGCSASTSLSDALPRQNYSR